MKLQVDKSLILEAAHNVTLTLDKNNTKPIKLHRGLNKDQTIFLANQTVNNRNERAKQLNATRSTFKTQPGRTKLLNDHFNKTGPESNLQEVYKKQANTTINDAKTPSYLKDFANMIDDIPGTKKRVDHITLPDNNNMTSITQDIAKYDANKHIQKKQEQDKLEQVERFGNRRNGGIM